MNPTLAVVLIAVAVSFIIYVSIMVATRSNFVYWDFWCGELKDGLSLSEAFIVFYILILNYLIIQFFVVPRHKTRAGWTVRLVEFLLLALVLGELYVFVGIRGKPFCRLMYDPDYARVIEDFWGEEFVPPPGRRAYYCGTSRYQCWRQTNQDLPATRGWAELAPLTPRAGAPIASDWAFRHATDDQLRAGLRACVDEIKLAVRPGLMQALGTKSGYMAALYDANSVIWNFEKPDLTELRTDERQSTLIALDYHRPKLGPFILIYGRSDVYRCFFDGAEFSRFEIEDDWYRESPEPEVLESLFDNISNGN